MKIKLSFLSSKIKESKKRTNHKEINLGHLNRKAGNREILGEIMEKKIKVAIESLYVDKETEQLESVVRFQLWIKSTDVEAVRSADFSCLGGESGVDYRLFDGDNSQGNFEVTETRDQASLIDGWFWYYGNSCEVFRNLTGIQLDWRCVN